MQLQTTCFKRYWKLVKLLASQKSYEKVVQKILPALVGWKLSSCPVLHMPFLPQWELHSVTNCTQKCLEWFTLILLCWRWFSSQGREIFAGQQSHARVSPEVRSCVTLHFLADALLFSRGCCYHFKNKHPRNFLLKQASPFQIQLHYFSWAIFNPCRIFGFFYWIY